MKLLSLLWFTTAVLFVSGETNNDNELCSNPIKCNQKDYKEYVNCLKRKRVKRQTCSDRNTILETQEATPATLPIIPCNVPNCDQNIVQNIHPCIGETYYCSCINSCASSCYGVRCGDRCERSCPSYPTIVQNPQIFYQPAQTYLQPTQSQFIQPIPSVIQENPPQVIQPDRLREEPAQSNPSSIIETTQTVVKPNEEVTIVDPLSLVRQPNIVEYPVRHNSAALIQDNTKEISYKNPNITTTVNLTNIINNTNIVNVPTNINNTNANHLHLGTNTDTNRLRSDNSYPMNNRLPSDVAENIEQKCCLIAQPKVCKEAPGGGIMCTQRQNRVCGEPCLKHGVQLLNGLNEDLESEKDTSRCCVVVQPQVCERVHGEKGGVKCIRRKHHTCGDECTSDTLHAQVRQPCNGPPESCPPQVAYVPQPQPRCSYQPTWPYVSCGNRPSSCGGCYDHYGYGFQQYHRAVQPSCEGCYDDGHQPGSLYRQGPYYQPGYYHIPPVNYGAQPSALTTCGVSGCFGNERIDPVFGAPSYSPYGAPQNMQMPQYQPSLDDIKDQQFSGAQPAMYEYPSWSQNPMMPAPCFMPPTYQPQPCLASVLLPVPIYAPPLHPRFPSPMYPPIVNQTNLQPSDPSVSTPPEQYIIIPDLGTGNA